MKLLSMLVMPVLGLVFCSSCATTPVKVVCTPFAAVRDVVDLPLASLASGCKLTADLRRGTPNEVSGGSGYGWNNRCGWGGGVGVTVDVTEPVMWLLSYVFGAPDYVLCRSLYPNFPKGISPWKKEQYFDGDGETWREFLFPNTRAVWQNTNGE